MNVDETYKCLNGGTCLVGDNGEVFCMCLDQYEGTFCEHGKILRIAASFYLEFWIHWLILEFSTSKNIKFKISVFKTEHISVKMGDLV